MLLATDGAATCARFFSATIIVMSWRRRARTAARAWDSASGSGLGSGRTRSAKSASMAASSVSVLASWPVDFPKSRACRGFTTATATPAAARAAAHGASYFPDASSTTSAGPSAVTRATSASMPSGSFADCHASPLGSAWTSRWPLATSIPM